MNVYSLRTLARIAALLAASAAIAALAAAPALAVALEPEQRMNLRMVAPIDNNTELRVWGNKYYPGDVLEEHMTAHFFRRMREVPRLNISQISGDDPSRWAGSGYSTSDLVIKLSLEQADFWKTDKLGSTLHWDVAFRMYLYSAATRSIVYETVVRERADRHLVTYTDMMEGGGRIYWAEFERTPYWHAITAALDDAFRQIVDGYNGYRIVGRIVAKAERVDGSLSVPKSKRDKLYHITVGREDGIREGDILSVTRSSSVRTIAPDRPEMHFPQVIARVKVIFVKGPDAVVEVIKESKEAPIQLGDAISAPLFGKRDARYF